MPYLIYNDDSEEIQATPLDKEQLTIGRNTENDLVLQDLFVSRRHASIELENGFYVIRDLGSSYGILINNKKATQSILEFGDEIQLGNTILTFVRDKPGTDEFNELEKRNKQLELEKKIEDCEQCGEFEDMKEEIQHLRSEMDTSQTIHPASLLERLKGMEETIVQLQEKTANLEKANKITSTLYEVGKIMNSVLELDRLLNLIMDLALKVMDAERGFIMLLNEKTDELETKAARNMGLDIEEGPRSISYGIASQVIEDGEPIMTADASNDPRFSSQVSVIMYNIRSVICVPLKSKDQIVNGVIYVDNRISKGYFSENDLEFLIAFANQASLAIENAKLLENIRAEEKLRLNLQRYLPINLVDEMLYADGLQLGGRHVKTAILFCDIKGFTAFSENLPPEVTVNILNDFFSEMTDVVFENEGTLDKYMGDGLMAIFGAPITHDDDSLRACKTALGMIERLAELNQRWKEEKKSWHLQVRIGINTGAVVAGNVGSEKRMDYTVIGDAVNLTSRLENAAEAGEILLSESTYKEIKEQALVKKLEPIIVKGKSQPVQVYRLLGLKK